MHSKFSGNNAAGYDGNNNLNNQRNDGTQDNFAGGRGAGVGSQYHHDPLYPAPNAPIATQNMPRGAGAGAGAGQWDDNYNGAQPGLGPASGATVPGSNAQAAEYPMRPQTDASGNLINPAHSTGGGGGKRLEGKVERVVGTMIGSQNLKAKGLAKEQYVFKNYFFDKIKFSNGCIVVFSGRLQHLKHKLPSLPKLSALSKPR